MANKPLKSIKFPGLSDTYTVPQFDSASGGMGTPGTIPDSKAVGDAIEELKEELTQIEVDVDALETATEGLKNAYNTAVVETVSGAVASFSDGGEGLPIKSLVVNITPVQSGSGDPAPDNVRPISGWGGVSVNACGANVWDEQWENGTFNTSTGENINNTSTNLQIRSKTPIPVKGGAIYYIKAPNALWFMFLDANGGVLDPPQGVGTTSGKSKQFGGNVNDEYNKFTTPNNCAYIKFYCQSIYGSTYNHDISINYPSTDHDYHAYAGQSIAVNWTTEAGTVYGGMLDVVSGVMTVDRTFKTFTGSEGWVYTASVTANTDRVLLVLNDASSGYGDHKIVSNYIGSTINNTVPWSGYTNGNGVLLIMLPIGEFASVEEWKTYLASHNLQVCYYLQTPLTIQLTAHEVRTLLGNNNVWADCGDVTVEYRADTRLFIESLTEPDADMVADANIVSGQYFMVGNTLYKATANIASGATITPNVNCTRKSLAEALNELNA